MILRAGMRLGAFEVLSRLGAGGMGEVWRARDSNLGRTVALKLLPDAFTNDPERLARFENEARVLASLNHPHIASLYGIEHLDGCRVLVMELAGGEDLAARLRRGPLPADEALSVARQVADALEEAHKRGVIHRDLKPANVMVSEEGKVKVLDFGLAKAFDRDGAGAAMDSSRSPTATRGTDAGVILGTAAYMSPEQARGKVVDERTDIWSFGVLFFEMLTSTRLFSGETVSDSLAALLTREPDWSALPESTPPAVVRLLRRCLVRDPRHRLQAIGDARIELEQAADPAWASEPTPATLRSSPRVGSHAVWRASAWLLLGATVAALALSQLPSRHERPTAPVVRTDLIVPSDVELFGFSALAPSLAMPPDGSWVAFIGVRFGKRHVFVRPFDRSEARALKGANTPFALCASPDGRALGVIDLTRRVSVLSITDGPETVVADSAEFASCYWDTRGLVFTRDKSLWEVPATGGPARQLTTLREGELLHGLPMGLPGGENLLFTSLPSRSQESPHIEVLSRKTGERRMLVERGARPLYAASGHLLFFREDLSDLFVVPFDPERLQLVGEPVPVPENIGARRQLALSSSGTLLLVRGGMGSRRLVLVTREGVAETILDTPRDYGSPRWSPDGGRILVEAGGGLWLYDLERRTFDGLFPSNPFLPAFFAIWSADGHRVFYRSLGDLRAVQVDGSGRIEEIWDQAATPTSVSPDGRQLILLLVGPDTSADLHVLTLDGPPSTRALLTTAAFEGGGQLSPDGRWLAHTSDESGRMEVYLRPFPGLDRRWQVSTEGGSYPRWNPSGREIFFFSDDRMMSVSFTPSPTPVLSSPKQLFRGTFSRGNSTTIPHYDVSPDGRKFLFVKEDPAAGGGLIVIQNWFQELERLAPHKRS